MEKIGHLVSKKIPTLVCVKTSQGNNEIRSPFVGHEAQWPLGVKYVRNLCTKKLYVHFSITPMFWFTGQTDLHLEGHKNCEEIKFVGKFCNALGQ